MRSCHPKSGWVASADSRQNIKGLCTEACSSRSSNGRYCIEQYTYTMHMKYWSCYLCFTVKFTEGSDYLKVDHDLLKITCKNSNCYDLFEKWNLITLMKKRKTKAIKSEAWAFGLQGSFVYMLNLFFQTLGIHHCNCMQMTENKYK